MISEKKKLLNLLDRRLVLESRTEATTTVSAAPGTATTTGEAAAAAVSTPTAMTTSTDDNNTDTATTLTTPTTKPLTTTDDNSNSNNNNNTPSQETLLLRSELDRLDQLLLPYFKCKTLEQLFAKFPTTQDMKLFAEQQRYFAPRTTPIQRTGEVYSELRFHGKDEHYLEFLRMSRGVFLSFVASVMTQNAVFYNHSNNYQEGIEKQLAITLWRMGHYGKDSGVGEASKIFGVSEGTIMKCTHRCLEALKEISMDVVNWPGTGEKKTIKRRIQDLARPVKRPSRVDAEGDGEDEERRRRKGLDKRRQGTLLDCGRESEIQRRHDRDQHRPHHDRRNVESRKGREALTDAVGIAFMMNVYLSNRPSVTEADEYLVPLPASVVAEYSTLPPLKRPRSSLATLAATEAEDSELAITSEAMESAEATELDPGMGKKGAKGRVKGKTKAKSDVGTTKSTTKKARKGKDKDEGVEEGAVPESTLTPTTGSLSSSSSPSLLPPTNSNIMDSTPTPTSTSASTPTPTPSSSSSSRKGRPPSNKTATTTSTVTSSTGLSSSKPVRVSKGGYIKRDHGFKVLIVIDPTTRIRFASVPSPAAKSDQDVYEASLLFKEPEQFFEDVQQGREAGGSDYLVTDMTGLKSDKRLISPLRDQEQEEKRENVDKEGSIVGVCRDARLMTEEEEYEEGSTTRSRSSQDLLQGLNHETLERVCQRGQDCQRSLRARFPSLMGLRVQINSDSQMESALQWVLGAMAMHNLILGDDTCWDSKWVKELEVVEGKVLEQQRVQHQQLLMQERELRLEREEKQRLEEYERKRGRMTVSEGEEGEEEGAVEESAVEGRQDDVAGSSMSGSGSSMMGRRDPLVDMMREIEVSRRGVQGEVTVVGGEGNQAQALQG